VAQADLATCVIARDQTLLRSFLEHCPLSLRHQTPDFGAACGTAAIQGVTDRWDGVFCDRY
jgi:hypothetical protein